MKDQRSDLTNDEILDLLEDDFEAVFESCKQEVSQYDEEQKLAAEKAAAAAAAAVAAESAPAPVPDAVPEETPVEAASAEAPDDAVNAELPADEAYAEIPADAVSEEIPAEAEKAVKPTVDDVRKESYLDRIRRKRRMNAKGEERKLKRKKVEEEPRSMKQEVYDWIQTIVAAMVACIVVFTFFVRIVGVEGRSMVPTLQHGDKLIVSNIGYTPERGDIVILRKDTFMEEPIVKRIIAVEGQEVKINFERGIVYVDGLAQKEPYINALTNDEQDFDDPIIVPENCVFVMGDNRNDSTDSRTDRLGCVDVRYIIGKVYFIITPGADQYGNRQISRIGSPYAD